MSSGSTDFFSDARENRASVRRERPSKARFSIAALLHSRAWMRSSASRLYPGMRG
jgi:hypothetical protein